MKKAIFPPYSGKRLNRRRATKLNLKTSVGDISVNASYGEDPDTGETINPLRVYLGYEPHQKMSLVLEERICYTATLTGSYDAAAKVINKFGCEVDDSVIREHVKSAGKKAEVLREERVQKATKGQLVPLNLPESPFSLVIMMDGWMSRDRGRDWGKKPEHAEGERVKWHEIKTAIMFKLRHRAKTQSGRHVIIDKYYEAYQGDPYEFGKYVQTEARRRGLAEAKEVFVVADGGVWIWNIKDDRFKKAKGVLDYYHASQHIWALSHELYPEEKDAKRWARSLLEKIKKGKVDKFLDKLGEALHRYLGKGFKDKAEKVEGKINYFEKHKCHMNYHEIEKAGCPIGSGAMESTCAQMQTRFKRTGQFWTLSGKKYLMLLELARRNGDWDAIWNIAA